MGRKTSKMYRGGHSRRWVLVCIAVLGVEYHFVFSMFTCTITGQGKGH